MSYANGALPASVLGTIPGTFKQLLSQLIPQTAALRDAFDAHFGFPLVITDAYRDLATQQALKISKGSYAATPGTSNHGWGRALDLGSGVNVDGSPEYLWMLANAPAYGWTHPAWASNWNPADGQHEPWHWEASTYAVNYPRAVTPTVATVPTVAPPALLAPLIPLTPTTHVQEDDMTLIIYARAGFWIKDGPRIDGLDAPTLSNLRAQKFADGTARFPEVTVTDALFDAWRADTSPVPTLVRAPTRGVGILGGTGGFTGLSSQDDVNRFRAAGAREIAVTDDDFDRLAN